MSDNRKYDGATIPTASHFTKEQRRRLEAVTFARKLVNYSGPGEVNIWVDLADYIIEGNTP